MFHIVLVEPEIPQNAGNIARTCAATGTHLHMIRPLGFEVTDKYLKRAGLDYWHLVEISYYDSFDELRSKYPDSRFFFFTTKGKHRHSDVSYQEGDFLVFGKETKGLPEELLVKNKETCLRIPMHADARSLNLGNSAAIALYEALRQTDFAGLKEEGELHRLSWEDEV
ncbi:MAG: tRNA (uridine(34)/cytosine(34)/5-carboxymethylaminomethyluridine(34)-2'-O)-methyltransferase TrmL [Clostridiales bacterium]|nr:tRNA (uridine(34)/cytosine(34)/5-carboxymethylaminomethyluridine(34)-2'-O)-methyltransferase TrmL [Clostridiales bacterium]MBQ3019221.1 tRNA (uridine(34)/cytosine(34)/5-carboxymethylaminomethyluridine(34)-2'-O)-methyltransferase TrmL [Clostridia bacterium]